jgi:hypothetical protein
VRSVSVSLPSTAGRGPWVRRLSRPAQVAAPTRHSRSESSHLPGPPATVVCRRTGPLGTRSMPHRAPTSVRVGASTRTARATPFACARSATFPLALAAMSPRVATSSTGVGASGDSQFDGVPTLPTTVTALPRQRPRASSSVGARALPARRRSIRTSLPSAVPCSLAFSLPSTLASHAAGSAPRAFRSARAERAPTRSLPSSHPGSTRGAVSESATAGGEAAVSTAIRPAASNGLAANFASSIATPPCRNTSLPLKSSRATSGRVSTRACRSISASRSSGTRVARGRASSTDFSVAPPAFRVAASHGRRSSRLVRDRARTSWGRPSRADLALRHWAGPSSRPPVARVRAIPVPGAGAGAGVE